MFLFFRGRFEESKKQKLVYVVQSFEPGGAIKRVSFDDEWSAHMYSHRASVEQKNWRFTVYSELVDEEFKADNVNIGHYDYGMPQAWGCLFLGRY